MVLKQIILHLKESPCVFPFTLADAPTENLDATESNQLTAAILLLSLHLYGLPNDSTTFNLQLWEKVNEDKITKVGARERGRRLLYFLGQAAERRVDGPAGQQPANGDQQ